MGCISLCLSTFSYAQVFEECKRNRPKARGSDIETAASNVLGLSVAGTELVSGASSVNGSHGSRLSGHDG